MEWSNEIGLEMISFVRSAGIPQQMISHMTESESGLGPLQGDMKGQVLEKIRGVVSSPSGWSLI